MAQFNVFFVPHRGGDDAQGQLNVFLRTHRVLAVERSVFPDGWSFCVEWMDGQMGLNGGLNDGSYRRSERIDYMKVLPPEIFARFSALRVRRKELAAEKGVKAYEVMTDAQLAEVAKLALPTLTAIGKIPGVGESRLRLYGAPLLAALSSLPVEVPRSDEPQGKVEDEETTT